MNRRAAAFSLIIMILFGCLFGVEETLSWHYSDGDTGPISVDFGRVAWQTTGSFIQPRTSSGSMYLYLGKEMLRVYDEASAAKTLRITNDSDVVSNVKLGLTATMDNDRHALEVRQVDEFTFTIGDTVETSTGSGVMAYIPLFTISFEMNYRWRWVMLAQQDLIYPDAIGTVQWNLQDREGASTYNIRPKRNNAFDTYGVIDSVRVTADYPSAMTEERFTELFVRKPIRLRFAIYAKQSESMIWTDWPVDTYEIEVKYL